MGASKVKELGMVDWSKVKDWSVQVLLDGSAADDIPSKQKEFIEVWKASKVKELGSTDWSKVKDWSMKELLAADDIPSKLKEYIHEWLIASNWIPDGGISSDYIYFDSEDLGCRGGLMDNAFKFDEKTGGLCSESDYPYQAKQGSVCNPMNCTDVPGTIVSTFYDVPPGKTKTLVAALAMQPISVAIQANQFVFQFYKGGVLDDDSCGEAGQLDHGVLAVGYGSDLETNEPYFVVKNSWGESWGENGFIRMSRKSKNDYGMCAILKMASYPEVK